MKNQKQRQLSESKSRTDGASRSRSKSTKTKPTKRPASSNADVTTPPDASSQGTSATSLPRSTTRLCVKNVPLQYTEVDLKRFIHEKVDSNDVSFVITDCRILKAKDGTSRRLAFVGLAPPLASSPTHTAESIAQHVLHRLDKTYCGTAKLLVEFAVLPTPKASTAAAAAAVVSENKKLNPSVSATNEVSNADKNVDTKKREFLAVMGVKEAKAKGTVSSRHVWSNDQDDNAIDSDPKDVTEQDKDDEDGASDSDNSNDTDEDSIDDADPLLSKQHTASKASAMDFLRSKQVADIELQEELVEDNEATTDRDDEVPMKEAPAHDSDHDMDEDDENDNDENDQVLESSHQRSEPTGPVVTGRLFLRNLPFTATEEDIRTHLQVHGTITECHIPVDDRYQNKGFAFVSFQKPSDAQAALDQADGRDFHGRLLHILPARQAPTAAATTDGTDKTLTYKEKQSQTRQQEAMNSQKGWMASFVRSDAVVDNLADRLGLRKGDILSIKDDLSSGDAAVRLALGETAVIEENRAYFANHGIDMEALVSLGSATNDTTTERSKTALLVKNLPHDTTKDDLQQIFQGQNISILLPPSRTIAVIEYIHPNDAKVAFRKLAYRRFKSVPLYLEWVPLAASKSDANAKRQRDDDAVDPIKAVEDSIDEELAVGPTFTVYVKNLSFTTTEDTLWDFFEKHTKDVRAVRIPQKVAPLKRQGDEPQMQSMGFGFVELGSKDSVRSVLKKLQGAMLDGHALELKPSTAGAQDTVQSSKPGATSDKAPCKLMVRNVPFQATRKELLQLFGSFGSLKKVRLPKKFDGSHRGFAFIEYLTGKEAAHAMKVLSRTHLYGRHLVIEWATADEEVEDLQTLRAKAERDVAPKGKKIRFD